MANCHASSLRASLSPTSALRADSRSPSRSPEKSASYRTVDPLLSNLSAESTIEALTSTDVVPTKEKDSYDILSRSISQVSPSERALGIRAAVATQRLGLWHKEIQTWEWPAQADAQLGKGFIPPSSGTATNSPSSGNTGVEYYGSLPARLVKQYERRIEEIRDGMESLDVEELKEHVLSAHIPSRSRPSSSNSSVSTPPPLSYVQLSDFTAVITATILRALPLLSRLNGLLSTWDARLLVLRQVPGLLSRLRWARLKLDSSLNSLTPPDPPGDSDAVYSTSNFRARKAELEAMVASVGRRMDSILDRLEGREDSLPENWIDDVEAVESGFHSWAKDAERQAAENERRRQREKEEAVHQSEASNMEESSSGPEYAEKSSPNMTDSATQNGSPAPMQTADEESDSIPCPVPTSHDTEASPLKEADANSLESHVRASPNECSPNSPMDTPPRPSAPPSPRNADRVPAEQLSTEKTEKDASPPSPRNADRVPPELLPTEKTEKDASPPLKQPLESPIKLSKARQKHASPEPPGRRTSSASTDSSPSDYPSLVSSPDVRQNRAASSNGTPLFLKTPPQFQTDYGPSRHIPTNCDHTAREGSVLRFDNQQNSPRAATMHNRGVSLPLQRFINEGLENPDGKGVSDGGNSGRRASVASADDRFGTKRYTSISRNRASSNAAGNVRHSQSQRPSGDNSQKRDLASTAKATKALTHNTDAYLRNSAHSGALADPPADPNHLRELSIRSNVRKPKDRMDEKVNSILSTLPAPIHLVSPADHQEPDSLRASTGEGSDTTSTPSRTVNAKSPSLTLTPALSRRHHSHSRGPEESSVKVYHLHRGGKSVPTKLFVRTVGGTERVMVRVGGGWADLGEYLREYAVHHGCRSISESPHVEVQGLSPHSGDPSSNEPNEPARQSIISPRPASSISAPKKRRGSNMSDMAGLRAASARATSTSEALDASFSAFPNTSSRRRLSVSSNVSTGAMSAATETHHRSFTPSTSIPSLSSSTPLGLAGPKPRSRQHSMSPAGEAWVEDVLGQARRSSSLNPHKIGMTAGRPAPKLAKARSIGDIASVGNRRVALRGLNDRRQQ